MHVIAPTNPGKVIELRPIGNFIIIANIIIIVITDTLRKRCFPPIAFHFTTALYYLLDIKIMEINVIQRDSKRWTQFRTSIFPELYMVCE